MQLWFKSSACMLLGLAIVGCGSAPTPPPPPTENKLAAKGVEDLKVRLKMLSETGDSGSSAMAGFPEAIKALPAEKSGALLKDWEELKNAGTAKVKVKAIAKRMLEKL